VTEAERYLAKARESLASARANVKARRYNSAANCGYYAAFQAAVAALIHAGIRPVNDDWGHRFVMSEFSGRLVIRRRKLPRRYRRTLNDLFDRRVRADYRLDNISRRGAEDSTKRAAEFIGRVEEIGSSRGTADTKAEYEERTTPTASEMRRKAAGFIDEIKSLILEKFPDCDFELIELGPRDYRVIVRGSFQDDVDVRDILDGRSNDILVDHGIWIVVLAESTREEAA
jgi:uncharacterized protein (UPF0332 family)